MEVGDEKGHILSLQRMEGLGYCENGEIVKTRSDNVNDFAAGKGVEALGYTFFTFEDGATIIVKFRRSVDLGKSGGGSAKSSSEIIKGLADSRESKALLLVLARISHKQKKNQVGLLPILPSPILFPPNDLCMPNALRRQTQRWFCLPCNHFFP
jgi:hypothetical protein